MEFEGVIISGENIRGYADKKVEGEKINLILECVRLAPSWTNNFIF